MIYDGTTFFWGNEWERELPHTILCRTLMGINLTTCFITFHNISFFINDEDTVMNRVNNIDLALGNESTDQSEHLTLYSE